ncbi:MAG: rRNA maturation RNase YbeY [Pseudomonadota bacterium]
MSANVDLRIADKEWEQIPNLEDRCVRAIEQALHNAGIDKAIELDLLLSNDDELAALNEMWRGKSGATDVLSFPADPQELPFIGDIAIAIGIAQKDAEADGKTLEAHLSHLLIHGTLHLLGYDHRNDEEAAIMESLERDVMAELGYADPYSRIEQS